MASLVSAKLSLAVVRILQLRQLVCVANKDVFLEVGIAPLLRVLLLAAIRPIRGILVSKLARQV